MQRKIELNSIQTVPRFQRNATKQMKNNFPSPFKAQVATTVTSYTRGYVHIVTFRHSMHPPRDNPSHLDEAIVLEQSPPTWPLTFLLERIQDKVESGRGLEESQ
jgi:hypothetical protein